jgi:hypothetical protein
VEDGHRRRWVGFEGAERVGERVGCRAIDGVLHLRAVQDDGRDGPVLLGAN